MSCVALRPPGQGLEHHYPLIYSALAAALRTFFLERDMSKIVLPPSFHHLTTKDLSVNQTTAVFSVCSILDAPPDRPLLPEVVQISARSLSLFLEELKMSAPQILEFAKNLQQATENMSRTSGLDQHMAMHGRASKFKNWSMMSKLVDCPSHYLSCSIGAELAISATLGRHFRSSIAQRQLAIIQEFEYGNPKKAEEEAQKLFLRLRSEAVRTVANATDHSSRQELLTSERIVVSLATQLDPHQIVQRQAAGTIKALTKLEVKEASTALFVQLTEGNLLALQIVVAFSIGLPWEVALDVPFAHQVHTDWVAQLDIATGHSKVDLQQALPGLAKGKSGHEKASQILVRPLAEIAATALHKVCASNPSARCLRDLNPDLNISSKSLIPGTNPNAAIGISIARFIASRGSIALAAGLDRAVAAYTTCDLSLIGKSKNHYLTIAAEEIWEGSAAIYQELAWGIPVGQDVSYGLAVGSLVTPTVETVHKVDQYFIQQATKAKAGKRYTSSSVINHTNAYGRFCAHRTAFFLSARGSAEYRFLACDLYAGAAFGTLLDKAVGPDHGKTPLPMPVAFQQQINLWIAHLRAVDKRLEKLGWAKAHPLRNRIRQIFDRQAVSLYFTFQSDRVIDLGANDLLSLRPNSYELNLDAYRHFVPNALRQLGLPSAFVDSSERHHVEGSSLTSATANVSQVYWLTIAAAALDRIALDLGMSPLAGLSKGV